MNCESSESDSSYPSVGDVVSLYGRKWEVVEVNPDGPRVGDIVLINSKQFEVVGVDSHSSRLDVGPTEAFMAVLIIGLILILAVLVNQFLKRL